MTENQIQKLINLGAVRWTAGGNDYLYLKEIAQKAIEFSSENFGNITLFYLEGRRISSTQATKILNTLNSIYINLNTETLHWEQRNSYRRSAPMDAKWPAAIYSYTCRVLFAPEQTSEKGEENHVFD